MCASRQRMGLKLSCIDAEGKEAKEDYLKRLRAVAKSLPPRYIEKLIESILARIQSVLHAKGFTPKKD